MRLAADAKVNTFTELVNQEGGSRAVLGKHWSRKRQRDAGRPQKCGLLKKAFNSVLVFLKRGGRGQQEGRTWRYQVFYGATGDRRMMVKYRSNGEAGDAAFKTPAGVPLNRVVNHSGTGGAGGGGASKLTATRNEDARINSLSATAQ